MNRPTLLDDIAATPRDWPQTRRVEAALDRLADTYREDTTRLRDNPHLDETWKASDVYNEVSNVLHQLAREIRQGGK